MYLNIEKTDLDVVQEYSYHQPNIIRLKPSSKANILKNRLNLVVSTKNIAPIDNAVENNNDDNKVERIVLSETKNADMFLFDKDLNMTEVGYKPINLSEKMFKNVAKKHDDYMEKFSKLFNKDENESEKVTEDSLRNVESETVVEETSTDKLDNALTEIDNIINDDYIQIADIHTATHDYEDMSAVTQSFIDLINSEVQSEKELTVSQEQLGKLTKELETANEIEKQEIVKKYELEEAIKVETERQKEILKSQSEKITSRINELKKEKVDIDMQAEEKMSELENTNMNISTIKSTNEDLASIYNAIINSNENRYENSDDEIAPFRKAA